MLIRCIGSVLFLCGLDAWNSANAFAKDNVGLHFLAEVGAKAVILIGLYMVCCSNERN